MLRSDDELIASARDGDRRAFDLLIGRYERRLLRLCRRQVGSDEAAEDVAQETRLRAWQGLPRFRGDTRRAAGRVAWRIVIALGALAIAALVALRSAKDGSYYFAQKGGGRVVVGMGVPFLPGLAEGEIDTGFLSEDFLADQLTRLQLPRTSLSTDNRDRWPRDLAAALTPTERARYLVRTGNGVTPDVLAALSVEFASPQLDRWVGAAPLVARLDQTRFDEVRSKLLRHLGAEGGLTPGQRLVVAATCVAADTSPETRQQAVSALKDIIMSSDGDNFLRIRAARALWSISAAEKTFILRWVGPRATDQHNEVKARAYQLLCTIDPGYVEGALRLLPKLMSDSNGNVRKAAFEGLLTITALYPERVPPDLQEAYASANTFVSRSSEAALMQVFLGRGRPEIERAAVAIGDFFLKSREDMANVTDVLVPRVAVMAQERGSGEVGRTQFLIAEMASPAADQWAVYRHACAQALPLAVPPSHRSILRDRLRQEWVGEKRPHVRVALAIALEESR